MQIQFKQKRKAGHYGGYWVLPALKNSHCDMQAFRVSKHFGDYANSTMFLAILQRSLTKLGVGPRLYRDCLPECVSVDDSGFLDVVTIDVPDKRLW